MALAGPELTTYLKAKDFESFRRVVRHYNHDVANRVSRITTECSILIRIAERVPPQEIFSDPALAGDGQQLAAEAKVLLDSISHSREFFYPPGDAEGKHLERWAPYDASGWDKMIGELIAYLTEKLQPIEPLMERLQRLEASGAVKPDGRGKPILAARRSMSSSVGELEDLLTPEEWDKLLPDWLNRAE